jgi:hypothetical protein
MLLVAKHKRKPRKVEMESNTQAGIVFEVGSLFARFQDLSE